MMSRKSPKPRIFTQEQLEKRFWSKVSIPPNRDSDLCWQWTAGGTDGYGQMGANGTVIGAHRFSYQIHYGEIPVGLYVLHTCDNRGCVNPSHLFLGTHADNMRDMAIKHRHAPVDGERNPNAKYTDSEIDRIFELLAQGLSHHAIARATGISRGHVSKVIKGEVRKR